MKPNVDIVNLVAIQELADVNLPALTDYLNIGKSTDKLGKRISVNALAQLISSALGSGSLIPSRRYKVAGETPGSVPPGASIIVNGDGQGEIDDPYLAGKVFDVHRNGLLVAKGVVWDNIVSGGGIVLLQDGDIFSADEEVIISFTPQFSSYIPTPDAIARFSNGERVLTSNATITAADFRKIIRVRSSTSSITVTLPAASAYPDNVLLTIVSDGGQQKQTALACDGSDIVYWDSISWPIFYIGRNDEISLIKSSGGWAIANWSGADRYNKIGSVEAVYIPGPNQFPLTTDAPVLRSVYPGFFNWLQRLAATSPSLVVSNTTWITNKLKFGLGDGTIYSGTTFNFPNWEGLFIRNVDPSGLVDTGRGVNSIPASIQNDDNKAHMHNYTRVVGGPNGHANFLGGGNFDASFNTYTTGSSGGTESRPKNGSLIYVINY